MNHPVIRIDLLRVQAEDAALLLNMRYQLADAPNATMADIHETDQRLNNLITYLRLSGDAVLSVLEDCYLENPRAGEAALLAIFAMERRQPGAIMMLLDRAESLPEALNGIAWAFEKSDTTTRRTYMRQWIGSEDTRLVCAVLVAAIHLRVRLHDLLGPLMNDARPPVRALALEYAGVMGRTEHLALADEAMADPEYRIAYAAALTSARFQSAKGGQKLIEMVGAGLDPRRSREAVETAFHAVDQETGRALVRPLLKNPETRRWGVLGLGSIGAVTALDYLLSEMEEPTVSRIAGWSFAMITGANVAEDDLELDEFPDDPEDPIIDACEEEDSIETALPWPDIDRCKAWIAQEGHRLAADHPLFFGLAQWSYQDMDSHDLMYQGRYRSLAQMIALREPQGRLPNWRAPVRLVGKTFERDWQV